MAVEAIEGLAQKVAGVPDLNRASLIQAVRKSPGQLIFYRIPYANLKLGLLNSNPHVGDSTDPKIQRLDGNGWRYSEVPVTRAVDYGLMVTGRSAHVEYDEGREVNNYLQLHIPDEGPPRNHYTNRRGVRFVTEANVGRIRSGIQSHDWILAVGNGAVGATAAVLAEKEIADTRGNMGVQESHGLLMLAEAKRWGVDWRAGERQNRQLTALLGKLQRQVASSGVAGVVLDKLGWDVEEFWEMNEDRLARRLNAVDLTFDGVKTDVMLALSSQMEARRKNVYFMGGNFDAYVAGTVDNVIENYLGIPAQK